MEEEYEKENFSSLCDRYIRRNRLLFVLSSSSSFFRWCPFQPPTPFYIIYSFDRNGISSVPVCTFYKCSRNAIHSSSLYTTRFFSGGISIYLRGRAFLLSESHKAAEELSTASSSADCVKIRCCSLCLHPLLLLLDNERDGHKSNNGKVSLNTTSDVLTWTCFGQLFGA